MIRTVNKLLLASLFAAGAAHSQIAFVPSPPISEEAMAIYETRVVVHNASRRALDVERSLLPATSAPRAAAKSRLAVPPGGAALVAPAGFRGLLALAGESALGYTARLVRRGAGAEAGVELPVVSSEEMFSAGETVGLAGLASTDSTFTNLALVNLARRDARCALTLSAADGTALGPAITIMVGALSNLPFLHVFEGRDAPNGVAGARAAVSCDQAFYAYAVLADSRTGDFEVVRPVAEGGAAPATKALTPCPAGAACFDADGVVHVPAPPPDRPVGRVSFPAPAGVAKRLRVSLDVTVADWYPEQPSGKALIYWFVVSKNPDMPGLLYFRGPGKNEAFARHGMGLKHPDKIKMIIPFAAEIGRTYHVDNDYDMARGKYTITITDTATGLVVATIRGRPNVKSFTIKPAQKFLVDMGFYPDKVLTEVPSYGWKYANVHVEAYLQ